MKKLFIVFIMALATTAMFAKEKRVPTELKTGDRLYSLLDKTSYIPEELGHKKNLDCFITSIVPVNDKIVKLQITRHDFIEDNVVSTVFDLYLVKGDSIKLCDKKPNRKMKSGSNFIIKDFDYNVIQIEKEVIPEPVEEETAAEVPAEETTAAAETN